MIISEPLGLGSVSTVGGLGTTQKKFQSSLASGTFVSGVSDYLLPMLGGNRYNGKAIQVRMSGTTYLHGTTPTIQLQLLGSVAGSADTILAQTSAVTLTTDANYNWTLNATLICGNSPAAAQGVGGSGTVTGSFNSIIGATFGAAAALTNPLAAVSMNTEPPFYLKAAVLFSVTDALDLAALTEFYIWQ